jgi:hypothetical protein
LVCTLLAADVTVVHPLLFFAEAITSRGEPDPKSGNRLQIGEPARELGFFLWGNLRCGSNSKSGKIIDTSAVVSAESPPWRFV